MRADVRINILGENTRAGTHTWPPSHAYGQPYTRTIWRRTLAHTCVSAMCARAAACGCVTTAGYKIVYFWTFVPKLHGYGTRRVADPEFAGVNNRGQNV